MRIYLASSFKLIHIVDRVSKILEEYGHTITEKWWKRPYQVEGLGLVETTDLKEIYENLSLDEFYSKPETKMSFEKDFKGVKDAQALVLIAGDKPRKFNGANIELGIAIGDKKPCFVLGEIEKSVLYYPVIRCRDVCKLISILHKVEMRDD